MSRTGIISSWLGAALAWLLFVLGVLWPSPGLGQTFPKECDPADSKSCVQAILEGETAPFSGQLMTNRRAAKLAVLAGGCQDRIDLAVAREKELAALVLDGEKALRASDAAGAQLQRDLLMRRMAAMEEDLAPRWYERPPVVTALSVVATVGVLVLSVQTVKALR